MAILHGLLQLLIVTAQSVQILADILKELVEVVAQIEALVVIGHARLIVIQQLPKKRAEETNMKTCQMQRITAIVLQPLPTAAIQLSALPIDN